VNGRSKGLNLNSEIDRLNVYCW